MKAIWTPKRKVWYQHNSDEELGRKEIIASPEDTRPIKIKGRRYIGDEEEKEKEEIHI